MSMFDTFETDEGLEKNGVIIDYGDFRVRLAHAGQGNKNYVRYAEKKLKPVRRAMENGSLGPDRSIAIMSDIFAKTIILDWQVKDGEDGWKSGIEAKDGSTLPFSEENVLKTLKLLPNLFLLIQNEATSIANYRKAELETEAGN